MTMKDRETQMYESLNYNIEECEYEGQSADEEWECFVCEITGDCLDAFTDADWDRLHRELPTKSAIWKRRLISCMIDTPDPEVNLRQVRALIAMADTDDEAVFAYAVGTLCDFDLNGAEGIQALVERARAMTPCAEKHHQMLIDLFLNKVARDGSQAADISANGTKP